MIQTKDEGRAADWGRHTVSSHFVQCVDGCGGGLLPVAEGEKGISSDGYLKWVFNIRHSRFQIAGGEILCFAYCLLSLLESHV